MKPFIEIGGCVVDGFDLKVIVELICSLRVLRNRELWQ